MLEKIMNKLGYISVSQAEQQVKDAEKEATKRALTLSPFEAIYVFAKEGRKFNFKVVSIEPNYDKVTQNAEKLANHLGKCINIKTDEAEEKLFAEMIVPLVKFIDDKSLLS